jgi:hypothetical protein
MSQYERRRRGNALPGDGSRLPSGGNTRAGRRGSGHLAVSLGYLGGRLDKTGDTQMTALGDEAVGKPGVAGVYTNQRLSLSTTWEGPPLICRGFKPDPGNLAVRDYRGASENVRHGETVNPPRNRKSGSGKEQPTRPQSSGVQVPAPPIACLRAVSISDARGGNEPRSART